MQYYKKSLRLQLVILMSMVTAIYTGSTHAQGRPALEPVPRIVIEPTVGNVVYREREGREIKLDLYKPTIEMHTTAPVILYFHGGGFRGGSRLGVRPSIFSLRDKGYAIVSADYSLYTEMLWPAQLHDARTALQWVRDNADKYNLNPDRIFTAGDSAGASVSALLAFTKGVAELEEVGVSNTSTKIAGAILFYPGADFHSKESGWPDNPRNMGTALTGCKEISCLESVQSLSPVTHVSKDDPPILIFHGMADTVIKSSQSILLHQKLSDVGVDSRLMLISGLIHSDHRFDEPYIRDLAYYFLDTVLKQSGE